MPMSIPYTQTEQKEPAPMTGTVSAQTDARQKALTGRAAEPDANEAKDGKASSAGARPSGNERRRMILRILREADEPLSGQNLGKAAQVSRQVVVHDIALLRTEGFPIVSTNRGYVMSLPHRQMRVLKCHHTVDETEDELMTIVDLGGEAVDVVVNHRVYGKMSAMLNIASRRDVKHYIDDIRSGKSSPLMMVTSGYHFHHIAADSEDVLDEIENALREKGYLAEVFPYESDLTL